MSRCVCRSPRSHLVFAICGWHLRIQQAVILVVIVYYSEKIHIKISNGKRCIVWEIVGIKFHITFPRGVM